MNRRMRSGLLAGAVAVVVLAVTLLPLRMPGWLQAPADEPAVNAGQGGASAATDAGAAAISASNASLAMPDDAVPTAMRQQFADIARAYAENARFPDYSKPLADADWNLLHPRAFVPRAATLANVPGVTATLEIAQSIVDRGIALPVQVTLAAEPGAATVTDVSVSLQQRGQRSAPVTLSASGSGASTAFTGELPVAVLRALPEGETVVRAEMSFANGERSLVTAMVKLYEPTARLVQLGAPRVEGADLVIPVQFDVRRPGQYRVSANLFAAASGEPVSHLDSEFPLAGDNNTRLLKVHAVTLREKGAAGPYTLRDIDITRLPDTPGEPAGHGTATPALFAVRGFPLDAYSDEPWEDPAARERLAFLQKLAGNP